MIKQCKANSTAVDICKYRWVVALLIENAPTHYQTFRHNGQRDDTENNSRLSLSAKAQIAQI